MRLHGHPRVPRWLLLALALALLAAHGVILRYVVKRASAAWMAP